MSRSGLPMGRILNHHTRHNSIHYHHCKHKRSHLCNSTPAWCRTGRAWDSPKLSCSSKAFLSLVTAVAAVGPLRWGAPRRWRPIRNWSTAARLALLGRHHEPHTSALACCKLWSTSIHSVWECRARMDDHSRSAHGHAHLKSPELRRPEAEGGQVPVVAKNPWARRRSTERRTMPLWHRPPATAPCSCQGSSTSHSHLLDQFPRCLCTSPGTTADDQ